MKNRQTIRLGYWHPVSNKDFYFAPESHCNYIREFSPDTLTSLLASCKPVTTPIGRHPDMAVKGYLTPLGYRD